MVKKSRTERMNGREEKKDKKFNKKMVIWGLISTILIGGGGLIVDYIKSKQEVFADCSNETVIEGDNNNVTQNCNSNMVDPTPFFDVIINKAEVTPEYGCYSCRLLLDNPYDPKKAWFLNIPYQFKITGKGNARIKNIKLYSPNGDRWNVISFSNVEKKTAWGTVSGNGYNQVLHDTNVEIGLSRNPDTVLEKEVWFLPFTSLPDKSQNIVDSLYKKAQENSMTYDECSDSNNGCYLGIFQNYFNSKTRNDTIQYDDSNYPEYEAMFGYNILEIEDTGNKSVLNNRKYHFVVLHKFTTVYYSLYGGSINVASDPEKRDENPNPIAEYTIFKIDDFSKEELYDFINKIETKVDQNMNKICLLTDGYWRFNKESIDYSLMNNNYCTIAPYKWDEGGVRQDEAIAKLYNEIESMVNEIKDNV